MRHQTILAALGVAALLSFSAIASAQETPAPAAAAVPEASAAPAPEAVAVEAAPSDPAAAVAEPAPAAVEEPPGRIIFFRPSRLTGAVYTYHIVEVGEDGDSDENTPRLGSLPNGRYFEYEATPGIHNFNIRGPMAVNRNEDRLRLEVEPGETYYVEQTVRMGLVTGGFALVPSTQAEFESRRLRPSVRDDD